MLTVVTPVMARAMANVNARAKAKESGQVQLLHWQLDTWANSKMQDIGPKNCVPCHIHMSLVGAGQGQWKRLPSLRDGNPNNIGRSCQSSNHATTALLKVSPV